MQEMWESKERCLMKTMFNKILNRIFRKEEKFDITEFNIRNHKHSKKLVLITKYDLDSKHCAEDLKYLLNSLSILNFDYELRVLGEGLYFDYIQRASLGVKNSEKIVWLRDCDDKHQIMSSDVCLYYNREKGNPIFIKKCMACGLPIVQANFHRNIKLLKDVKYRAEEGIKMRKKIVGEKNG